MGVVDEVRYRRATLNGIERLSKTGASDATMDEVNERETAS